MIPSTNIKAVKIKDTGATVVQLSRGTWLVDDKECTIDSWNGMEVVVQDPKSIKFKYETTSIDHYKDKEGNTITVDEYEQECGQLSSKGYYDEDSTCGYSFGNLGDEFKFRLFKRTWTNVCVKSVEWLPVTIEESFIQLKTDNPFITSMYTTVDLKHKDCLLYEYDRRAATKNIVAECFTRLGMVYVDGISYSKTEGQKVWGNSNNRHLEYVVAFNRYIFSGDKSQLVCGASPIKGTLESLLATYNADKNYLETIIESGYNVHFRNPEIMGVLLGDVISKISSVLSSTRDLNVKQSSTNSHRNLITKLSDLLGELHKAAKG